MQPRETMRSLPRFVQPYLTWVTGVPLAGEQPLLRWCPAMAGGLGLLQLAGGIALGSYILAHFAAWRLPLLVVAWLTISGGMRRLDVVIVHQTLHNMVASSPRINRIIAELITTILWRVPYDANRREHLLHHAFPCSMKDGDTHYLLGTGMRPGMTRAEYHSYLLRALLSPKHHWTFFSSRISANFSGQQPRYRLAMSIVYLVATLGFVASAGLWTQWLLLWVVPVSYFFQCATFLYTHTEHRWWRFANAEKLSKTQRDELTFARLCGEPAPDVNGLVLTRRIAAWAKWWMRILLVHTPYRMFVLVGDTVQHDLHHVRPGCDWANSAYERTISCVASPERYFEVWGSLMDHLYAAGNVRAC